MISAVRAGTGGDEAGIWAGDLVGTCFFVLWVPNYLFLAWQESFIVDCLVQSSFISQHYNEYGCLN